MLYNGEIVFKTFSKISRKNIEHLLEKMKGPINIMSMVVLISIVLVISKSYNANIVYKASGPEIQSAAQKISEDCFSQNREACYESSFKSLIMNHNFSYAEQTLYALQDLDPMTKSCHIISHFMSRTAVEKNPGDWLSVLDSVDVNACGSGFLHGVLEAHLGDDPDTEFNAELSEEVCNRGDDAYRKRMCTHFMGHFFIVSTNDDVAKAVPICDGVSNELKFDCLNGLFMEHNQKIALVDHELASAPVYSPAYAKSLEDVCQKYSDIAANACYTELAEVYAKTFGYDAEQIYKHCYKTDNKQYAQGCYSKGGTVLSTYPLPLTPKQLTDICKFYKTEGEYKNCLDNILASLMYYSPKFTERGLTLCQNIPKYGDWCVERLGNRLSQFVSSPEERLTFCQSAENEKYKNLCAKID